MKIGTETRFSGALLLECNESWYQGVKFGLIMPLFMLWCVAIPLWTFWSNYKSSKQLSLSKRKLIPKFMVQQYKQSYQEWDAVKYFRNFVLCVTSAFLPFDYYNKALINVCLIGICFYLTETTCPYKDKYLNFLEISQLVVNTIITLTAISIVDLEPGPKLTKALFLVFVLVETLYLGLLVVLFIKASFSKADSDPLEKEKELELEFQQSEQQKKKTSSHGSFIDIPSGNEDSSRKKNECESEHPHSLFNITLDRVAVEYNSSTCILPSQSIKIQESTQKYSHNEITFGMIILIIHHLTFQ